MLTVILFALCLLGHRPGQAETLFEGYSKVFLGGSHVGYFVSRYDFDPKKKQFVSIYLLKTNEAGGSINETLKALANEKLEPISYLYVSANKTQTKTIDATFKKNKMSAKVTVDGKSQKIERTIPSGVFLSNFLAYVILKSPGGMKTGTKYEYQAIAEEDGELSKGIAFVKETETYKGLKVFKIINEFKNMQFVSMATDKGEMLSTSEPTQAIGTEVVGDPKLATTGFSLSEKNLKLLFGSVPKGTENTLSKMLSSSLPPTPTLESTGTAGGFSNNSGSSNNKVNESNNSSATSATMNAGETNATSESSSTGEVKTNKGLPTLQATGVPTKQMGVPGGKGMILKSQPKK
jgi:hypothetical protein